MANGPKSYGFGVIPEVRQNHFLVVLPGPFDGQLVRIYERYRWTMGEKIETRRNAEDGPAMGRTYRDGQRIEGADTLRLEVPPAKWEKVADTLAKSFNERLHKEGLASGRFAADGVVVSADFGKEMMVLLWGVVDADPGQIDSALENWKGLRPEERRWLYTTTNERWGGLDEHRGWRAALREVLCASPDEKTAEIVPSDGLTVDKPPKVEAVRECRAGGFGDFTEDGIYVSIPAAGKGTTIIVYDGGNPIPIVKLPLSIWKAVVKTLTSDFNQRLKEEKKRVGKFGPGLNGVSRLLGKEMMVLLWSLENGSVASVPTAIRNWQAFMPEERWWLYTQTAAAPRGWKRALRSAIAEANQSYLSQETLI